MAKQGVVEAVAELPQQAGVRHSRAVEDAPNHLTDAVQRSPIGWAHVRHEEVDIYVMGAGAYFTGTLANCAGRCDRGSLHFINGIIRSRRNRV